MLPFKGQFAALFICNLVRGCLEYPSFEGGTFAIFDSDRLSLAAAFVEDQPLGSVVI